MTSSRRGSAPRSYKRSDDRIREDISERCVSEGIDASNVEIQVSDGTVTLTGEVNDRDDKYRLETIASDISGVQDVENRVRVRRQSSQSGSQSGGDTSDSQGSGGSGRGSGSSGSSGSTSGSGSGSSGSTSGSGSGSSGASGSTSSNGGSSTSGSGSSSSGSSSSGSGSSSKRS